MIGKKKGEKYQKIWQKVSKEVNFLGLIYFIEAASDSEKSEDEVVPVLNSEDYERLKVCFLMNFNDFYFYFLE